MVNVGNSYTISLDRLCPNQPKIAEDVTNNREILFVDIFFVTKEMHTQDKTWRNLKMHTKRIIIIRTLQ